MSWLDDAIHWASQRYDDAVRSFEEARYTASASLAGADVTQLSPSQQQDFFQCMRRHESDRARIGDSDGSFSASMCLAAPFIERIAPGLSSSTSLRLIRTSFTPVASMECGVTMSCEPEPEGGRTVSCDFH